MIYWEITQNWLYLKWLKGVEISYDSYEAILTEDLGTRQASAKFVSRQWMKEQKDNHLSMTSDLQECAETGKTS